MAGTNRRRYGPRPKKKAPRFHITADEQARRERVGAFIRRRREQLGLTQAHLREALGYRHNYSISAVENAREGLALKRIYAWADVLKLPRDDFFQFVVGTLGKLAIAGIEERPMKDRAGEALSAAEQELIVNVRRLSPKYQARLRDQVAEYLIVEGKEFLQRPARNRRDQ
ncbi:MAG: helix-turn-helix domain-containing protein [Deltaproteobacteria bacterium]